MSGHRKTGNGSGVQRGYNAWATNSCSSGKRTWVHRADAKTYANRLARSGVDKMNAFRCDECGLFHIGHLAKAVVAGEMTREEFYGRRIS